MNYFPAPKNKLNFQNCEENIFFKSNFFSSIPYHSINIFVPTAKNLSEDCREVLGSDDFTYFLIKQISAFYLVDSVFITNFVKKGSLSLISQEVDRHCKNFVSLSLGKLVLKLESNIAQHLSILKEKCSSKNETYQTCIIHIDSEDFVPEKKYYITVLSELKKIDHLKFDMILKWKPSGNVCSESILKYFESINVECMPCESTLKVEITSYIPVPKIDFQSMDSLSMGNIVEWIGTQICGVRYADEEEKFISKFYIPEPFENRKIIKSTLQGFFVSDEIRDVMKNTRDLFVKDSNIPFIAVILGGYQYCFVDSKELQEVNDRDKIVCVLISPQYKYWIFTLNA